MSFYMAVISQYWNIILSICISYKPEQIEQDLLVVSDNNGNMYTIRYALAVISSIHLIKLFMVR